MPRLRLLVVAAGLVVLPVVSSAQDAPKTHTVKKGDTLWGIAKLYFSDPFLWPEIYRVNTDVVEDPHWIYPGEILRIPDVAALQRRTRDEEAVKPAPERLVEVAPPPPKRVFQEIRRIPPRAVRSAEYLTAPFVSVDGGPPGSGRILAMGRGPIVDQKAVSGNLAAGMIAARPAPAQLHQYDDIIIQPPSGVNAVKGDRFMVFRLSDKLAGVGQVVEPVGVVQVEDASNAAGGRAFATVRDMFHDVRLGDYLMPMDTLVMRDNVFPAGIDSPLRTRVLWVQRGVQLPTIGDYVIVGANAKDGLVTGDQITLMRERGKDKNGQPLPMEILAIAQVHRVTALGASALIIDVSAAGTQLGTIGRLTAKMP